MKQFLILFLSSALAVGTMFAQQADTTRTARSLNLDEVVITGSRTPVPLDFLPIPVSIIDQATIERSAETNLLPVLARHVPSLFVTSRGMAGYGVSTGAAGGINMRGFGGGAGRVLILIDGHPQYATIYGHPVADAYIASDAERVEVSRGAASILYGSNAMGGAINIITRKALADGNKFSARLMGGSYGTQRYTIMDSYRNGRFSGVIGGNYEKTDGHRNDMGFESFSGYGKVGYELSERWRATGNVNIAKSKSQNPGSITVPRFDNKADVLRGMSGLSVENNYGFTSGAINLYYNWGDHEINDGYLTGANPQEYLFNSTDYMGGTNVYQTFNIFDNIMLTGGFDLKLYGGNAYRNPKTEHYADHVKLYEVAGYVLAQQKMERSMFEVGLRIEKHELYGTEFVPQAGFSIKAAENTNLKLSASKGFRTPNMRELYMFGSANEDLSPENSWSYDLTASQGLLDNRLTAELTIFYTKGENLIEAVTVNSVFMNRNVGNFINKGVEFSLNYQIKNNLHLHSNYSYLEMDTPITGAPRHKFYAGLTYNPGRFSFNLGAQGINKLYTLVTADNTQTDSFLLFDARASYRPVKWMDVFVNGENLTAQKYETMFGYPMPRATVMGGIALNL